MTTVLISGASVAGPALAYWLQRRGFSPVVVERAPDLRPGGQAIDIRGVALEVISRMGLLPAVDAQRTRHKGVSVLDAHGKEQWRSEERTLSAGRFDSGDIEILKDDLTSILYEATKSDVHYRFNDSVAGLEDAGDHLNVEFASGKREEFDIVVGADGIYSRIRRLIFGAHEDFLHHLGGYVGIFTAENFLGLKDWQIAIRGEESGMLVYPALENTELRVFAGFQSEPLDRGLDIHGQKRAIAERCGKLGWEVPRLLREMADSPAFFFGPIAQIRMPAYSKDRVCLVGDAAYCPSPASGQGTSLALVGSYILAAELSQGDPQSAFERYHSRMRPFVEVNQALATRERNERPSDEAIDHAKNAIQLGGFPEG